MARGSPLTKAHAGIAVTLLLAMFYPAQPVVAGTTWPEGPAEFASGTLENVVSRPDGVFFEARREILANNWSGMPESAPSARYSPAMVYDGHLGEMIMFGGYASIGGDLNDTWTYNLSTNKWTKLLPEVSPPAREWHTMVYDSVHGVVVLFGGIGMSGYLNDTWTFNSSTNIWRYEAPKNAPPPRVFTAMAYDCTNEKVVLFAGRNDVQNFNDTWTYDLDDNTWVNMSPMNGPKPRNGHKMAYDIVGGETVLFGGSIYSPTGELSDTWTYNMSANTWVQKKPASSPSARAWHQMVYDPTSDRTILFGGYSWPAPYVNDTWSYDLGKNKWSDLYPQLRPPPRNDFSMGYDTIYGKVILFGGAGKGLFGDTWAYDIGWNSWTDMNPPVSPLARYGQAMAYDEKQGLIVMFGGENYGFCNDTWTYDPYTNVWMNKLPAIAPSRRTNTAIVYDIKHDEMILFGGEYFSAPLGDTWTYNLSKNRWMRMDPPSAPSARYHHATAYDSMSGVVVLFGGFNDSYLGDTWTYDIGSNYWVKRDPVNSPPPRAGHAMAYDSDRGEVLLFGGGDGSAFLNDTWTYNSTTNKWTEMNSSNPPPGRSYHAIAFNGGSNDLVLHGGIGQAWPFLLNDTWIYDPITNNWTNTTPSASPPGRYGHALAYDSYIGKLVLFGGGTGSPIPPHEVLADVWVYELRTTVPTGVFTSLPHDTGGSAYFGSISWNASTTATEALRFQLRSAGSASNLSDTEFAGPDGTNGTYYCTSGLPVHSKHNGTRWFQYRAYFATVGASGPLLLRNVTICYNLLHSVKIISPAGGEIWNGINNITWSASDPDNDPMLFHLYLVNETAQIGISPPLGNGTCSWALNTTAIPQGKYRVELLAHDQNRSIPLTTNAFSGEFTIARPPHVDLSFPPNNSVVNTSSIHLAWNGTDPDNDPLTYTVRYSDRPLSNGSIDAEVGGAEYLDLSGLRDNTTYYWTVDARDWIADHTDIPAEVWSFRIGLPPPPVNHPPRITSAPPIQAWVGREYAYNITSMDEDGDLPTYSLILAPSNITLDPATGRLRWTPVISDIGNHTVTVRVSDDRGSFDSQTFVIEVLDIPPPPPVAPTITITSPANGSKVSGRVIVRGTAQNGTLPLTVVQVSIDGGDWQIAVGLDSWTCLMDTAKLARGKHRIEARALDANLSSGIASVDITVYHREPAVSTGENAWCLPAVVVMVATVAAVLLLLRKKLG